MKVLSHCHYLKNGINILMGLLPHLEILAPAIDKRGNPCLSMLSPVTAVYQCIVAIATNFV